MFYCNCLLLRSVVHSLPWWRSQSHYPIPTWLPCIPFVMFLPFYLTAISAKLQILKALQKRIIEITSRWRKTTPSAFSLLTRLCCRGTICIFYYLSYCLPQTAWNGVVVRRRWLILTAERCAGYSGASRAVPTTADSRCWMVCDPLSSVDYTAVNVIDLWISPTVHTRLQRRRRCGLSTRWLLQRQED